MSKISYVTGNLHRISDQIAEASGRKSETSPSDAEESPVAGDSAPASSKNSDILAKSRYFEAVNLRRDLECRLEEQLSRFQAEAESMARAAEPVHDALSRLSDLSTRFREISFEEPDLPESARSLADAVRKYEKIRLEILRVCARAEGVRGSARSVQSASGSNSVSLPELTFRRGFLFFLPLGIVLIFCTLILSIAFVAAWKMAF